MAGRFIVIEGIDGSGKSTLMRDIESAYRLGIANGKPMPAMVFTREPTTDAPKAAGLELLERTFLFLADRCHHVPILRQNLAVDWNVICDRWHWSTLVYQILELPSDQQRWMLEAAYAAKRGLEPDLTILLDVPAEVAQQRLEKRLLEQGRAPQVDDFNRLPTLSQLDTWRTRYVKLSQGPGTGAWHVITPSANTAPGAVLQSALTALVDVLK